jgi:serine protease Do
MKLWMAVLCAVAGILTGHAVTPAEEPVVQAVAKTLPAVVNINTESLVERKVRDFFFDRYYTLQRKVPSLGSGVLIAADGYIVTNAHVVEDAEKDKIKVTLSNGSIYQAKFLSSDPDQDLALLKVEDKNPFPFLDMKNLSPNLLGQTVIALGNPVGYQSSVSQGILSAKNRTFKAEGATFEGLLQTDAAINPGNSGGALVDIAGNFVGLNSAKVGGTAIEGIGFAIPADKVVAWAEEAIAVAKGLKKAPTPVSLTGILKQKFGFTLQEMTEDLADAFGFRSSGGLIVTEVEEGSPAAKAKLQRGMLIVGIGNVQIVNESSLPRDITRIKAGDKVPFTIAIVQSKGGFILQRSQQVTMIAR